MRTIDLKLEPVKVKVTHEEILADLRYPAPAPRRRDEKAGERGGR